MSGPGQKASFAKAARSGPSSVLNKADGVNRCAINAREAVSGLQGFQFARLASVINKRLLCGNIMTGMCN